MGLDTVELLMVVEDHFGIEIANEVAARIVTVGDLHTCVLTEVARQRGIHADERQTFEQIREIVCYQLAVAPELVRPEACFVEDLGAC